MFSMCMRLQYTISASLLYLSPLAMLANLAFLFGYEEFVGKRKHFPVLHLLDGMNESLRERSKYSANTTSAPKFQVWNTFHSLTTEPKPETCMLILIICVLWQRV